MNILFKIGKFPFSANGKALAAGEPVRLRKDNHRGAGSARERKFKHGKQRCLLVDERANELRRQLVDWSVKLG
jgi:hypothetical protein